MDLREGDAGVEVAEDGERVPEKSQGDLLLALWLSAVADKEYQHHCHQTWPGTSFWSQQSPQTP